MTQTTVQTAPAQLRQSAAFRGRGWTSLVKGVQPAAGGGFTYPIAGDFWRRILSVAATLATSSAAGIRQLNLVYQDGDGNIFNLVPISNEVGPSQTLTLYGDQASVTPVEAPESHQAEGSATSPAALTTLTSLVLPSGGWTLAWQVQVSGTVGATEINNFGLYNGTTLVLQSENGNTVGQDYPQDPIEIQVPTGGATYNIKNIALATTGAVYAAQLVATPANVPSLQVQIPDFILKSGWQLGLQLVGAQAADQLSGILILEERYPSSDYQLAPQDMLWAIADAIAAIAQG